MTSTAAVGPTKWLRIFTVLSLMALGATPSLLSATGIGARALVAGNVVGSVLWPDAATPAGGAGV